MRSSAYVIVRINNKASILTAKLYDLQHAVDFVLEHCLPQSIIFWDSLSAHEVISSSNTYKNPLVIQIQQWVFTATQELCQIVSCWDPSPVGIPGNDVPGHLARWGIHMPTYTVPHEDYKRERKCLMIRKWRSEWSQQEHNKPQLIKPILKEWERAPNRERFYGVVLCWL